MSLGNMFFSTKSLLCLGLLSSTVAAHTWIEQMQVIGTNGSYVGDYGYPRGYVSRTDAGFDGFSNKWQLPSPDTDTSRTRITDKMLACHPNQRTPNYSQQYPKLSVAPPRRVKGGRARAPGTGGKPWSSPCPPVPETRSRFEGRPAGPWLMGRSPQVM